MKTGTKKTQEQAREDVQKLDEQLQRTFPEYTWEDRAMWSQTPQEFLFGMSPLQICATEDIEPLLKWLQEREPARK